MGRSEAQAEGRFARLEAIEWWDRGRVESAGVLVVGAGALGNEVLKNLALLGFRRIVVVDSDRVEPSNLSRSVLFREEDTGRPKAICASEGMAAISPECRPKAIVGHLLGSVGLGYFRWADVVVGAVDNREARLAINAACARLGKPWVDGGIDVLHGTVRGFSAQHGACYECTLSAADWRVLEQRRSCSLLARRAAASRGVPTTPTVASVIGGLQAQEALKSLHGLNFLVGRGFWFDGLAHDSYAVEYPVRPECPHHEPLPEVLPLPAVTSATPLTELAELARERLGGLDALDLEREIVTEVHCPSCRSQREVWQTLEGIDPEVLPCPGCGTEQLPEVVHSLGPDSPWLGRSPGELGLPCWDIVWARHGDRWLGLEVTGDRQRALPATWVGQNNPSEVP